MLGTHRCTSNPQKYSGNALRKAHCRHFGVQDSRLPLASMLRITLMAVKLRAQIFLSILRFGSEHNGDPEFLAARRASSDYGSAAQPFDNPEIPLWHKTVSHILILPARMPSLRWGQSARYRTLEDVLAVPFVPRLVTADSAADGLRSGCGSKPRAPIRSSQGSLRPHDSWDNARILSVAGRDP